MVELLIQHAIVALTIENFNAYGDLDQASSINEFLDPAESAGAFRRPHGRAGR